MNETVTRTDTPSTLTAAQSAQMLSRMSFASEVAAAAAALEAGTAGHEQRFLHRAYLAALNAARLGDAGADTTAARRMFSDALCTWLLEATDTSHEGTLEAIADGRWDSRLAVDALTDHQV